MIEQKLYFQLRRLPNFRSEFYDRHWENGLPGFGTPGSAGVDLRAMISEPLTLIHGQHKMIPTGLAIWIGDPSYCGKIYPRSGGGCRGLVMANTVGIIDSDYQGELMIAALNRQQPGADSTIVVNPGERIAQLVIERVCRPVWYEVDEFKASARGAGGFGHTGQ